MLSKNPEIQILLKSVENRFNFRIKTASDFECLSADICQITHAYISPSTLKRLWGYIKYKYVPRETTLDILARYAGYMSYNDFCYNNKAILESASKFLNGRQIDSSEIKDGSVVSVLWQPDRYAEFQKEEEMKFRVIVSKNGKLKEGDECIITTFIDSHPLYVNNVIREGVNLKTYVAGKQGGVKILNIKPPEDGE
jgi:hypothetical protein